MIKKLGMGPAPNSRLIQTSSSQGPHACVDVERSVELNISKTITSNKQARVRVQHLVDFSTLGGGVVEKLREI